MKKQIITIVSVALATIMLFVLYSVFFKDNGIEVVEDPFYQLSQDVKTSLSELDEDVNILISGYDSADDNWIRIYRFSESIVSANRDFSLKVIDSSFKGVTVSTANGSKDIPFENFYKTLYDGTYYAFDGEALISNAILSLCGKDEIVISLRALSGYDTWGDKVTANGEAFMFQSLERSKIAFLTVENPSGKYSIIQENNEFYFDTSPVAAYDDEKFSAATTAMRYPIAAGKMKMPEGKDWSIYKLDKPENATASYSIVSTQDSEGRYFIHTVYVGTLAQRGEGLSYYYARYIGAQYKSAGKSGDLNDDELLHNLSKDDVVYFLSVDTVENAIMLRDVDLMTPTVINAITDNEELFTIDNVLIDYYNEGISAVIKNFSAFDSAANLASANGSNFAKPISNKLYSKEYSSYSDGWKNNLDTFAGFTSSDGNATYIQASLAKSSNDGNYSVELSVLRDEAKGAYLPSNFTVTISYDGTNWHSIENGIITPSQTDKTVARYSVSFSDDKVVKFVRIVFDVPKVSKSYVVFDEVRVFVGDEDAQPAELINGIWKLVSPSGYVPAGRNYAYLDMTNFNDFIQSIATLSGERVVACGFSDDGDATDTLIDKAKLKEFGLDTPARHYSFVYDGIKCDVYVSAPTEDGKYYAYSTYSGDISGKYQVITTDVVVELSTTTAKWLSWNFVEFLDHSLFSMMISEIDRVEVSFDGNVYEFDLTADDARSTITNVSYQGKGMDVSSFKYLYRSMISINMQDEYLPEPGQEGEEYLRIKIHSETYSPEIVFYSSSVTRCYFTVDGEGSYYALVDQVNKVRDNTLKFIAGETVTGD